MSTNSKVENHHASSLNEQSLSININTTMNNMNISPSDLNHDYFVNQLQIRPDYAAKLLLTINSLQLELANKTQEIAQLKEQLSHSQQQQQQQQEQNVHIEEHTQNEHENEESDPEHTDNANLLRSPSLSMTPPSSYAQITPSQNGENDTTSRESLPSRPDSNNNNLVSFSMNISENSHNTEEKELEPDDHETLTKRDQVYITDIADPEQDDLLFQHRITRAWRWDDNQQKWRGRGKGLLSIYYCKNKELAKIVFCDERHDKTRLLQYIVPGDITAVDDINYASFYKADPVSDNVDKSDLDEADTDSVAEPEENKEEIVWNGIDYVMDVNNPLCGDWKVRFENEASTASIFKDIYNWFVDAPNKTMKLPDVKTINNQETKDLVNGYIKEFASTSYDIIPTIVYHWCLLYTHQYQHRYPFQKHTPWHNIGFDIDYTKDVDTLLAQQTVVADAGSKDSADADTAPAPDTTTTATITTSTAAMLESDVLFRQNIAIPEDKEESKKFVGKPINFDEVKLISQKLKDKVCGYIREAQKFFPWEKNIFYTIPQQVYHWCLLYIDDSFPKMVRDVYNDNINTQIGSVRAFRKLLSSPDRPPIQQVIDSGVVPRFVHLLQNHSYPELQYESLWALLNIASGEKECVAHVVEHDSHNHFISLLADSPYYEVKEQAMWALGNIAGDGQELKDLLLSNNDLLINALMICGGQYNPRYITNFTNADLIRTYPLYQYVSLLSTTSWALSNFCRGSPPLTRQHLEMIIQCIKCLMTQGLKYRKMSDDELLGQVMEDVESKDDKDKDPEKVKMDNKKRITDQVNEICSNIAWATSYLTSHDYGMVGYNGMHYLLKRMFSNGTISEFINLMDCDDANIRHACNRVVGNILTGSDDDAHKCIQLGVLDKYHNVLAKIIKPAEEEYEKIKDKNTEKDPKILKLSREKKEICWALSNILAGPIKDKLLVLDANLFPILCEYLISAPYDVAKEALWSISNATSDKHYGIINALVMKHNVLPALSQFLNLNTGKKLTHRIKLVAFECIENILESGANHGNIHRSQFETSGLLGYLHQVTNDPSMEDDIMDKADEFIEKYFNVKEEEEKPNEDEKEDVNDNDNDDKNKTNDNDDDNELLTFNTNDLVIDLEEDKEEMHIKEQMNMHGIAMNDDDNQSQIDEEYDEPIEF